MKNFYFRTKISSLTPFCQFVLCYASNNTTSREIGRTDAWAVPPPQIFGGPFPQFPLSLRPCVTACPN